MDLFENLSSYLSQIEINKLKLSLQDKSVNGVLLNTRIMDDKTFLEKFPLVKKHPIVEHAYIYDKDDYDLGKSIYHELGCFYLQEPSSMIPSYLLNVNPNDRILDLCAAPGGKSIQLSFKLKNRGMIISNDISLSRAKKIIENVDRLGISNIAVTNNDFSSLYTNYINYFDKIILDAPCSGSGMFRKDEEIKKDWSMNKVLKFSKIQKDLIIMCYSMLKPGGTLLYSTCSFSFEEDEEIIDYLLKNTDAVIENIPLNKYFYQSKKLPYGIHMFPHLFTGEGQYACLINKPGKLILNKNLINNKYKHNNFNFLDIDTNFAETAILNDELYCSYTNYNFNVKGLRLLHFGTKIGKILKNKVMKYDFSFARSEAIKNQFDIIEINKGETEKIINGDSLETKLKDGIYLLKYDKYNLSFAKSDGRILKNWYYKPSYIKRY